MKQAIQSESHLLSISHIDLDSTGYYSRCQWLVFFQFDVWINVDII